MASKTRIITSGSGTGVPESDGSDDYIRLPKGNYCLGFRWASTPGAASLVERRIGGADTEWADVIDGSGDAVQITTNTSWILTGGREYSIEIDTHSSVLTVDAELASD